MYQPDVSADPFFPVIQLVFACRSRGAMYFSRVTTVPLPLREVTLSLSEKLSITEKPSPERSSHQW